MKNLGAIEDLLRGQIHIHNTLQQNCTGRGVCKIISAIFRNSALANKSGQLMAHESRLKTKKRSVNRNRNSVNRPVSAYRNRNCQYL